VQAQEPPPVTAVPDRPETRRSNRLVGLAVLGIMVTMATVGLIFALRTQDFRRANDFRLRRSGADEEIPPAQAAVVPTAAVDLSGLGWLPADSNVVAGIHIAEALQAPEGQKLLEQLRAGPAGMALSRIEHWTGLKLEALDHLVAGLHLTNALPQLTLVVQTRRPYAPAAIARAVHPAKPTPFPDGTLYRLPVDKVGEAWLWCAAERTLVFRLSFPSAKLDDLKALPRRPTPGAAALAAPLRNCLRERVEKGSLAWLAAHLEDASALETALFLSGANESTRELLTKVQTFGAGVRLDKGVTLTAAFQLSDAAAAREFEKVLERNRPQGLTAWTVVGPPPAGEKTAGLGNWVTLQARDTPEGIQRVLAGGAAALLPRLSGR
jgi:hypothetical protein